MSKKTATKSAKATKTASAKKGKEPKAKKVGALEAAAQVGTRQPPANWSS